MFIWYVVKVTEDVENEETGTVQFLGARSPCRVYDEQNTVVF